MDVPIVCAVIRVLAEDSLHETEDEEQHGVPVHEEDEVRSESVWSAL